MNQIAERYLTLLVQQAEHDARVMTDPRVIITVIPLLVYFFAALLKWYLLLAPVTVPLTFWPTIRKITAVRDVWLKDKAKSN